MAVAVVEEWPLWRVRADHYFSGGMGMKILVLASTAVSSG